ncbi:MAG: YfiR family protein [Deltaproteobacteria bacterium]|nr:YfiR family protein [Deltaproteobacteria bacterium]
MIKFRCRHLFLIGLLILGLFRGVAIPDTSREYPIKAAFLYNFAKFVEWPAESFKNESTPIHLYILGVDPFGPALDPLKDQIVRSRKIMCKRIVRLDEAEDCEILYISASEKNQLPAILGALKKRDILTVSDLDRFAAQGGMIGLVTVDNKIQFEINLEAVRQTRLKISSQLLKLARIIPHGAREMKE